MVTKLIGKLIEIETALRSLREEIVMQSEEIERKELSEVNLNSLVDVTPAEWHQWFSDFTIPTPIELSPYRDILPRLLVGFGGDGPSPVRFEQRPYLSASSALRHSLNFWLTSPVDWFTVEFRLPQALIDNQRKLYFAWTGSVNVSQRIRLNLYQRNEAGYEFRSNISDQIFPSMGWSEVKFINLEPRANITITKLLFEFETGTFQSITLDDIRLYIPADAAG